MGHGCSTARTRAPKSDNKQPWDTCSCADDEKPARDDALGPNPPRGATSGPATRPAASPCAYMMPTLKALLERNAEVKLLDVGCGAGSITAELARIVRPAGRVTGCDLSAAVLETAKALAEQNGLANVEYIPADVARLPFADGTFDLVHTHQAVAHFRHRAAAIRELIRVTKKGGGVLCMREGDLHTARFYPVDPVLEECFEAIIAVHAMNGGATDAGRRLKRWTVEAGVPRENIVATYSAWSYSTPEGRKDYGGHWPARCTHGAFAERATELGITQERLNAYALAWKQWTNDPDGVFAMMHGEVIAKL